MAGGTLDESFFRSTEFKLGVIEFREKAKREEIAELKARVTVLEANLKDLIIKLTQTGRKNDGT
jgi:hypothetical protein